MNAAAIPYERLLKPLGFAKERLNWYHRLCLLRYLWAYSASRGDIVTRKENLLDRRREQGFDVEALISKPRVENNSIVD